jgi:hypothetical protein
MIPTMPEIEELLDVNAGLVGASTGYMTETRSDWPWLVAQARALSGDVVELSALCGAELPGLAAFLDGDWSAPFAHVSVHGPSKRWREDELALADALLALPASVDGIVMHPETLGDVDAFAPLGGRLRLENMDTRKPDGRTTDELGRYFAQLPQARFCFDIAHAWQHDAGMGLAHELLDAFGDRLVEVHLSSIDTDGAHVPLRPGDVDAFAPVLERCAGVPWVLEAPLPD